jgi:hypothetical protein
MKTGLVEWPISGILVAVNSGDARNKYKILILIESNKIVQVINIQYNNASGS